MKKKSSSFRSHWHCVYELNYHLVLVTKYRKKCLSKEIRERLKQICIKQCSLWDISLMEFGGEADHIHLLLRMHPNIMISRFVNSLKTVTSRMIRKEFLKELEPFYWKSVLWTRAYFIASTGGAPVEAIKRYIENQGN